MSKNMMEKLRVHQASLLAMTILATAAAAMVFGTASAANYTVGEPGGSWDLQTNLTAWASTTTITFHPSDHLVFKYDASAHDVVEVTQAGYRSCSASTPVSAALRTGSDAIQLDGARRRYFICSTPGHCVAGMKLEVRVVTDDDAECTNTVPPPAPPVPPGAPGAPGGINICSGSPPVVIMSPAGINNDNGAAPKSLAGLGSVVATVVMVSLSLLGLTIV